MELVSVNEKSFYSGIYSSCQYPRFIDNVDAGCLSAVNWWARSKKHLCCQALCCFKFLHPH